MPDKRSHRGPHPQDQSLFGVDSLPTLRSAARDYIWLLNHGYPSATSMKLVGDRFQLAKRQRVAVARSTCDDLSRQSRMGRCLSPEAMSDQTLWIDGFNVLVTLEAALGGGVVLDARDGCYRDMSSMHGTYRKTAETALALTLIGQQLARLRVRQCSWYFDRPVSNSGRLAQLAGAVATRNDWPWTTCTVDDPDGVLAAAQDPIATADSAVLDQGAGWFNLASYVIQRCVPDAWVIDLIVD